MPSKIIVRGGKELKRDFRKITSNFGPALNELSRKAMRPMVRAAKSMVPVDEGDLKRALVLRRVKGSPENAPEHRLGARRGAKGNPGRYSHLVERGRPAGADGQGGYEGSRFMTRAFDATKEEVKAAIKREWPAILAKRLAKLRSKGIKRIKL